MAVVIREPRVEDFPEINALGSWFQQSSAYSECGWSETKIMVFILQAAESESDVYMRVVEKDGSVIGVFLGHVTEYFFSDQKIGQELVMLLRGFCEFAADRGAREVCVGITSGIAGPGYKKLLNRLGFKDSGVITKRMV